MELIRPEELFKDGVSPSSVKEWLLCRRRWYNNRVRGLKEESAGYAGFGKAIHNFLEQWHSPKVSPNLKELVEGFRKDFPTSMDTDSRSQDLGVKIIHKYVEIYPRESEPFKVIELEKEIIVPLEGMVVPLHIVVDGIIEYQGGLWVIEHKSTSRLGADFFTQFRNDYQIYAYLEGVSVALGKRIEGVLMNGIGCKKKVDRESFLRNDEVGCKGKVQVDYHMGHFKKIVNEMVEFVMKNWKDVEAFTPSSGGNSCKSYNTQCPYLRVCEYMDSEIFLNEIKRRKEENGDHDKGQSGEESDAVDGRGKLVA